MSAHSLPSRRPDRYRVVFQTVAGYCSYDVSTVSEARRRAKAEGGYVLAQWIEREELGRSYVRSERLR